MALLAQDTPILEKIDIARADARICEKSWGISIDPIRADR
jgi:hypothetical protein